MSLTVAVRGLTGAARVLPSSLPRPGGYLGNFRALSTSVNNLEEMTVTRIYSDEDGNSRFGSFKISLEGSGDIGYLSKAIKATSVIFRKTPSTYCYSWHTAPQRQFIVNLDADVEVEVSGGEKQIIKQGEVFFVEDVQGNGHFSKSVSNKARNSVFIPVDDSFRVDD